VLHDIEQLLAVKRRSGEQEWLPARPLLNAYLDALLAELAATDPAVTDPPMTLLDELLFETVRG
jgi:uncharacterized protein